MRDRGIFGNLILVIFAFLVCYLSAKLSIWGADGPGDGLFPFMSGMVLGLCAIFLLVQDLFKDQITEAATEIDKGRLFVYIFALLVYASLFNYLGFFVSTFLYMFTMLKGLEKGSWKSSLFISSAAVGILYTIFYFILDVPLPLGIINRLIALF